MKNLHRLVLAGMVLAVFLAMPAMGVAADGGDVRETAMPVGVSVEVRVEVSGLVCAFCAVGLRKGLLELPFVDTEKPDDGVWFDEKDQKVVINIKPGHAVDVERIRSAVKAGGYESGRVSIHDKGQETVGLAPSPRREE